MGKKHYIECAKYLLERAFSHVASADSPFAFPIVPGKTYPQADSPAWRFRSLEFESLERTLTLAAPLMHAEPDITIRGIKLRDYYCGQLYKMFTPGHASNHMAFVLREENALFSGDHVMGWATTVVAPPDGNMRDYMASLDAVIARDFATLWPTHGAPVTQPAPFLAAYRAHRLEREAQVLARLRAGDRSVAEMVPVLYAAVDQRLWPAASLSVLAHLIKLVEDGAATAEPEPGLRAVFDLA